MPDEIEKKTEKDGDVYWAYNYYETLKYKASFADDDHLMIAYEKFGNVTFPVYFYCNDDYHITDIVFDLRNVYQRNSVINSKFASYRDFLYYINEYYGRKGIHLCSFEAYVFEGKTYVDKEYVEGAFISLANHYNYANRYAHFIACLIDMFDVLNEINGKRLKELDVATMEKQTTKLHANKLYVMIGIGIIGLLLIILKGVIGLPDWLAIVLGVLAMLVGFGVSIIAIIGLVIEKVQFKSEEGLYNEADEYYPEISSRFH